MLIVTKGSISHNGLVYRKGQALPEMPKADELRLLDLKVCVEGGAPITAVPQQAQQEVQQGESAKNSSDLNIDFNPDDAIVGKNNE